MATSHFPATIQRQNATNFRRLPTATGPTFFLLSPPNYRPKNLTALRTNEKKTLKWVSRLRSVAQEERPTTFDAQKLVDFLYEDLPHLFDDQGIDRTAYDERVKFTDPITKHDTISGYLFNIAMLRKLFDPDFQLHWAKQNGTGGANRSDREDNGKIPGNPSREEQNNLWTGPYEITTRWTMVMRFVLLPWNPELVFTGTSVMGINPDNNKFCSHADYWDSIKNNEYFSVEGLLNVFKQLRPYKTPDLETPKYQILKRAANYEVRKYEPFIVVETNGDKLAGSSGFNSVAGYIFGKNSTAEKIPMTTPVFTQAFDPEISKVSIQIVLPSEKDISSLPAPNEAEINLRKVEGGIAAVTKFSGKPDDNIAQEQEKRLRSDLVRDGLKTKPGFLLARYNDPGRTWNFIMRNEVLIWLEEFSLD